MNKINKTTKKELRGSAGIALAFFFGAMAINSEATADNASAAAEQYQQEANIAAESGNMGQANASNAWLEQAGQMEHKGHDAAASFGALGLIALGVGLGNLSKQAQEDSRERVGELADPSHIPELPYFDDSTQRIDISMLPPVPPVLQKR